MASRFSGSGVLSVGVSSEFIIDIVVEDETRLQSKHCYPKPSWMSQEISDFLSRLNLPPCPIDLDPYSHLSRVYAECLLHSMFHGDVEICHAMSARRLALISPCGDIVTPEVGCCSKGHWQIVLGKRGGNCRNLQLNIPPLVSRWQQAVSTINSCCYRFIWC
jgi:hypothetical protein